MNDRSKFDRAYEAFRAESEIAPPKARAGSPSTREDALRALLFECGLAPKIDEDGDLFATYRGWTCWLAAPDDDPEWTALTCTLGPYDERFFEQLDETIVSINAEVKCVQAFRFGESVRVTLGLLTEAEPSAQLLHRCFRIIVSALERLVDSS